MDNSLDTAYGDVVEDGVGDAVLKPSNIRESVRELGSLQVQHVGTSTAMASIPPLLCYLDGEIQYKAQSFCAAVQQPKSEVEELCKT